MLTDQTPPFSRYFCPLDCDWFHDAPEPTLWDEGPDIELRPGESMQDAVDRLASGVLTERMRKIEGSLREHMDTHTMEQALVRVARQRDEMQRLGRTLEEVRQYAKSCFTAEGSTGLASAQHVLLLLEKGDEPDEEAMRQGGA